MANPRAGSHFKLLRCFQEIFEGKRYSHRNSILGDKVASNLYEDLVALDRSALLRARVHSHRCVVNMGNRAVGKVSRRGDGTFGELVPTTLAVTESGLAVARGEIANIQIGAETKILAKAMIKQIDRVIGDLIRQAEQFKATGGHPIIVGIVGINHASRYTSYEGERAWPTDGKGHKHPAQEALAAETRVALKAAPAFDELLVLRFRAENVSPYPFDWVNFQMTQKEYGALLLRLSRQYDQRFA